MAAEDSPSPEIIYPQWLKEYEVALLEPEAEMLSKRVEAAEAAIYKRLQQISQDSDHHAERQVIEDALAVLRVLKREQLASPDWERK